MMFNVAELISVQYLHDSIKSPSTLTHSPTFWHIPQRWEVEMAVREWLRKQQSDVYRDRLFKFVAI
jgi:hypothetical protein